MTEINNIKVTIEEKNLIINNGADKLPLNPTSQGFSGQSVRKQLSQAVTGARGSVLALMIEKFAIIEDFSNTVLLVEVRLVGDDLTFIYADGREFKFSLDVITGGLEQDIIATNERIDGLLDDMNLAVKIDYDTITRTDNDELQVSNEVINDINSRTKNNDFVAYQQLARDYLDNNIFTKTEINAMLSATYKPKGTITGTELLAITPTSDNEGFVYNISTEFTTTIDFIGGAGITHIAGENVVIVENTEGDYKFDVLSGFVDLSSYALKTELLTLGTTSNDAYRGDLGQTAYNHSQSAHAPSNAEQNVQSDWNQTVNTEDDFIKNKPSIPSKTSDLTNDSGFATETYVNTKVSAVYKPQGSVLFSSLVVGLLVAANSGFVYNITDAFTTNENFVEGAGKSHSAGTNVVIIEHSGNYKFDALSGTIDLSSYALKTDIKEDVVFQATSLDSLTSEQKSAIVTQIGDVLTSGEIDKEKFKNFILEITLTGNKHYYQCVQYFLINGIATLYFASTQTTGIIKLYVDTLTPTNSTLTNYKYYDGIQASASSFSGSTTNYLQSKTNVDEAIKELDAQVKTTNDSIPDISLNDNTSTEGKYISKLEIDSVNLHKINITKADLPTIPTVTNDLTDALKSNYDAAYTHSTQPHAPSNAEQNVQSDWNQTINTEDDFIKNKPAIPSKTSDLTNDSGFATETYVNNKVSTVYKPQGSVLFSSLVVGLLVAANSGFVYNITDAFTTNENFIEGAGKSHSAGTNVVIIENSGNYKFDVLSGTVDLTPYELQSNKVSSWSETTNDTRYPSEKLVKDSLDAINVGLENIGSLSPLRFAGYFTGGTVSNDFNNLIKPFENLTEALPDFYINNIKGAMFVCNATSDFVFNTVYTWADGIKTTPITFNWAAPYDQGIGTTNFEVGDTISILNFAYDTVENEMFILIKVEKNPAETFVVKNDTITGATKAKITYDAKGLVTAGADLIADDIPALPITKITNLSTTLSDIDSDITALENTVAGIETLLEAI